MAALFPRKDSRFIWIRYLNEEGKWRQKSTGLRKDVASDRRRASELEAEHTLRERQRSRGNGSSNEDFDAWVMPWLDLRYSGHAKTHDRYKGVWTNIRFWLEKHNIKHPRQVRRDVVIDYIPWRQKPDVPWLYKVFDEK